MNQRSKRVAETRLNAGTRRYKGTGSRFHRVPVTPSPFARAEDIIIMYVSSRWRHQGPKEIRVINNLGQGRIIGIDRDGVERPYDVWGKFLHLRDSMVPRDYTRPPKGHDVVYYGPRSGYECLTAT